MSERDDLLERAKLLQQARALQARGRSAPAASGQPGEITPADLFGSTQTRMAASFADKKTVNQWLASRGFKNFRVAPNGDYVAQGDDGKWYRDKSHFSENPIQWAAGNAGYAFPTAGMVVGEGLGALSGPQGMIAGAGAGQAGGEAFRRIWGGLIGAYHPDSMAQEADSLGGEALKGGMASMGGQLLGRIPLPVARGKTMPLQQGVEQAGNSILDMLKSGSLSLGSAISRVPKAALLRSAERPDQVLNAPSILEAARLAAAEAGERKTAFGEPVDAARSALISQDAAPQDTTDLMKLTRQLLSGRNRPNESGAGRLTTPERQSIIDFARANFLRERLSTGGALPNAVTSKTEQVPFDMVPSELNPGPRVDYTPISIIDRQTPDVVTQPVSATPIRFDKDWVAEHMPWLKDKDVTRIVAGPEQPVQTPLLEYGPKVVPGATQTQSVAVTRNKVPEKSWDDLLKTADYLDTHQVGSAFDSNPLNTRSQAGIEVAKQQRRAIKAMAHEASPALEQADQNYSEFARNADVVAPVMEEKGMEGFTANLFGKNKTAQQEAAEQVFPQAYNNEIQDSAAARAFHETPIPMLGGFSRGQAIRGAVAAATAGAGSHYGADPDTAAMLGLLAYGGASPAVWKLLATRGSQALTGAGVRSLPSRVPTLFTRSMNPWTLTQEEQ